VFKIVASRDPFQVGCVVIGFVEVYVVDLAAGIVGWSKETKSHETVNVETPLFTVFAEGDSAVSFSRSFVCEYSIVMDTPNATAAAGLVSSLIAGYVFPYFSFHKRFHKPPIA
jgi:hypothetical protein